MKTVLSVQFAGLYTIMKQFSKLLAVTLGNNIISWYAKGVTCILMLKNGKGLRTARVTEFC